MPTKQLRDKYNALRKDIHPTEEEKEQEGEVGDGAAGDDKEAK